MDFSLFVDQWAFSWVWADFLIYSAIFGIALYLNFSFNIWMVGWIYWIPLLPFGLSPENASRFLTQSIHNTVFGIIELAIFVITVRPADATFDRSHVKQLLGHTLPIAVALIGLSYVARLNTQPLSVGELSLIMGIFAVGSVFRVLAVYQLGSRGFKFDIVFREKQKLQSEKLYSWVRHPSYAAMMMVILAYALNAHDWRWSVLGLISAWFGFQYRIYHEERALLKQFGKRYERYREKTGMWFPRWNR